MTKRLVDPIHVFDSNGRSLLRYEQQEREIIALRQQVVRLTRRLRKMVAEQDSPPVNKAFFH